MRKEKKNMKKSALIATLVLIAGAVIPVNLSAQTTDVWYIRGKEYYDQGDYTQAIEAFRKAIESATTRSPGQWGETVRTNWTTALVNTYLFIARAHHKIGNQDTAVSYLGVVAQRLAGESAPFQVGLGDTYGAIEEYDRAIPFWEKYLDMKSADEPIAYTVDKSYPADMWFCATLYKKATISGGKYEKWLQDISDKNPVTRAEIEAFFKQNMDRF
jgi:tetratricopeptide (TPR) repeat protein